MTFAQNNNETFQVTYLVVTSALVRQDGGLVHELLRRLVAERGMIGGRRRAYAPSDFQAVAVEAGVYGVQFFDRYAMRFGDFEACVALNDSLFLLKNFMFLYGNEMVPGLTV